MVAWSTGSFPWKLTSSVEVLPSRVPSGPPSPSSLMVAIGQFSFSGLGRAVQAGCETGINGLCPVQDIETPIAHVVGAVVVGDDADLISLVRATPHIDRAGRLH